MIAHLYHVKNTHLLEAFSRFPSRIQVGRAHSSFNCGCYIYISVLQHRQPMETNPRVMTLPNTSLRASWGGLPVLNHHFRWPRRFGRYNLDRCHSFGTRNLLSINHCHPLFFFHPGKKKQLVEVVFFPSHLYKQNKTRQLGANYPKVGGEH